MVAKTSQLLPLCLFVLLFVLVTRFDGEGIESRANPNYNWVPVGKHARHCALLHNEDFINRFGNPEACLVETKPESPSRQITVFLRSGGRAVVQRATPFLFPSLRPRLPPHPCLPLDRCLSRVNPAALGELVRSTPSAPRGEGGSAENRLCSFNKKQQQRISHETVQTTPHLPAPSSWNPLTLSPEPQPRSTVEQASRSPLTLSSDPQLRLTAEEACYPLQTYSGAGFLEPAHPQLRPTAEQASWSPVKLSSDPQLRSTVEQASWSLLTLSPDPQLRLTAEEACHPPQTYSRAGLLELMHPQPRTTAPTHSGAGLEPTHPQLRPTAEQVWSPLTLSSDPQWSRPGARSYSAWIHSGADLLEPAHPQPGLTAEQKTSCPKAGLSCQTRC